MRKKNSPVDSNNAPRGFFPLNVYLEYGATYKIEQKTFALTSSVKSRKEGGLFTQTNLPWLIWHADVDRIRSPLERRCRASIIEIRCRCRTSIIEIRCRCRASIIENRTSNIDVVTRSTRIDVVLRLSRIELRISMSCFDYRESNCEYRCRAENRTGKNRHAQSSRAR